MDRIEAFKTSTGIVLVVIHSIDAATGKIVPIIHEVTSSGLGTLFGPTESKTMLPAIRRACDVQDLEDIPGMDILGEDL